MDPTLEAQAERIFAEALELSPKSRAAFVERSCEGNAALRSRVDSLLDAYEQGQVVYATARVQQNIQGLLNSAAKGSPEHDVPTLVGRTLSHYRIVEKIGAGGMGVVWKAEDTVLHRIVAIKVLPADFALHEKRRKMFLDEARLAASLSHGNIVHVHELGHEDDLDFIVMEYVEGQPLNSVLAGKPLRPEKLVELGLQVAQGLARAHRSQLIHRDLKPANILVTPEGEVKIVDFGLATLYTTPHPPTASWLDGFSEMLEEKTGTAIVGTLPYMSPEQVRREKLDARSDIFSLGIVLYEMATGRRPFAGSTPTELAQQIEKGSARRVHELVADVPLELDRVIDKALAPAPEDRYQTMDDLVVDLRRLRRELRNSASLSFGAVQQAARDRRIGVWSLGIAVFALAAAAALVFWLRPGERGGPNTAVAGKSTFLILPFENHGPPEDGYIVDRVVSGLNDQLSRIPDIAVVTQAALQQYDPAGKSTPRIAADLRADYVIRGSVRSERRNDSVEEFSKALDLTAGDHVDFSVGDGGNGYNSDSSGISVTLTGPEGTTEGARRTYDAFEDFSIDGTGTWAYGYRQGLGGEFVYLPVSIATDSFLAWEGQPQLGSPNMARNVSGRDVFSAGGVLMEASEFLHIHPGAKGEHSVLRFIVPATGTYELHARFKNLRVSGPAATTDVHVLVNGRSLYDGVINVATNLRWRVSGELVRARDDTQMWANEYDCRSRDLDTVSIQMASAVIDQVGVELAPTARTAMDMNPSVSVPAHLAFVRGRRLISDLASLDPESWSLAIHLFERALEHDADFLPAHAALARAHAGFRRWKWDRSPARLQKAEHASQRALELDRTAPEAHVALGYYHCWGTRDLDRAWEAFENARESWPDSAIVLMGIAEILARRGEFGRSAETLETALRTEPTNAMLLYRLAETYSFVRRYREAESALTHVITLAPDAPSAYLNKANNALLQGQIAVAWGHCEQSPTTPRTEYASVPCRIRYHWSMYQEALDLAQRLPGLQENQFGVISRPLMMATIFEAVGESDSAQAAWEELIALAEPRTRGDPENAALRSALGLAYAGTGRADDAEREGQLAVELSGDDMWERPSRIYELAQIYLLLEDNNAAVAQLEIVIPMANNLIATNLLRYSPLFDPIRDHPRYPQLLSLTF